MGSSAGSSSESAFERELREMNEASLISAVRQHELIEEAQRTAAALRKTEQELRAQAEELARINRVAVGRESRMLELKKEINALARRFGEVERYPIDAAHARAPGAHRTVETLESAGTLASEGVLPLESILCTEELAQRPARAPEYETESCAFVSLVRALVDSPADILQVLAQKILEVLKADSAGLSLLTTDEKRFYWPAIAGVWRPYIGADTPRDFGPCCDVFDRDAPLLFRRLERRYAYFRPVTPPVEEALLVPFYLEGRAVGTVWAVSQGDRRFDAEDLRQLQSLGRFASAAYQTTLEQSRRAAALNLMEDAVQSRRATEQVNQELRASEERYHTLFNSIDEGFCLIEMLLEGDGSPADFRILEVNPGFEKQGGLHDAVGKRARELLPQLEASWFERYARVALTGESIRFIDEARALGGRWFDVYAFRLGAPERRLVALLFADITERKRLEQKTQEQALSLADLNRRKDEFLAMLSHELRNPLASILNAVHLMRLQRDRSPVQVQAQAMIDRQVSQLARLVDDLLEVSRISTGRIRLQLEPVDVREILRRAAATTRTQADQKGQLLTESLPGDALLVQGDAVRLEQVVVNLLNNASKYTDRGGQIAVTLQREGDEAVLRVRDNGVGIAPDMLPRVFDLFTQAGQTLDRAQGGLGIGLALVQSLVTMHGGRVEAHSTQGEGSEFVVRLPVLSFPHESTVSYAEHVPAPARVLKVLVVDDNLDAAQSLGMLLQSSGHDIRLAHDGVTAVKVAQEFTPHVVLLDLGLPGVDGFQVAKSIRLEPTLSNVLLVALTGYGRDSDRQHTQEAGIDYHLVKPVDFEKIESILSTAADNSR